MLAVQCNQGDRAFRHADGGDRLAFLFMVATTLP